jgi:hypothetical protein
MQPIAILEKDDMLAIANILKSRGPIWASPGRRRTLQSGL